MDEPRTHANGTLCPEGTQKVPKKYKSCCSAFEERTFACNYDIRYEWWNIPEGWFIVIDPMSGSGGIAIQYCPHCGLRLSNTSFSGGRFLNLED